jgi:hypothetical protein
MTSTRGIACVPWASAATAWAPPIRYTSSTSHRAHAARITGCEPGAQTTTSSTSAARAVTAPITTVLGYGFAPARA